MIDTSCRCGKKHADCCTVVSAVQLGIKCQYPATNSLINQHVQLYTVTKTIYIQYIYCKLYAFSPESKLKDDLCPRMERPVKKLVKEILRNLLSEARAVSR